MNGITLLSYYYTKFVMLYKYNQFLCCRLSNHDAFVSVALISSLMMFYFCTLTPPVVVLMPNQTALTSTGLCDCSTKDASAAGSNINVTSGKPRIISMRTYPLFDRKAVLGGVESRTKRSIVILGWTDIPKLRNIGLQCNNPRPCVYTTNRSLYRSSDAVIIDMRETNSGRDVPSFRLPHQYWLGYFRESPSNIGHKVKQDHAKSWFNWTIAYSMNSDVVVPYGMCLPTRYKVEKDPSSITDVTRRVYGKSVMSLPWLEQPVPPSIRVPVTHRRQSGNSLVAWVVSHCHSRSRRERYVAELKQHIDIDIFGKCTGNDMDDRKSGRLFADLYKTHKFYLSFENSFCPDYITEKVWSRLQGDIVPIVLGGADYEKHLPPHSYINVKDFRSPMHLAEYLHILDKNDTLYKEYFTWKRDYSCYNDVPNKRELCDVCRMIDEGQVSVIPNINTFWDKDSCISTADFYHGIMGDITGIG